MRGLILFHASLELELELEVFPILSLLDELESKLLEDDDEDVELELLETLRSDELLDELDEDDDSELILLLDVDEELELDVLLELDAEQVNIAEAGASTSVPSHTTLPDRPLLFLSAKVIVPAVPCPIATSSE